MPVVVMFVVVMLVVVFATTSGALFVLGDHLRELFAPAPGAGPG